MLKASFCISNNQFSLVEKIESTNGSNMVKTKRNGLDLHNIANQSLNSNWKTYSHIMSNITHNYLFWQKTWPVIGNLPFVY